MAIEITDDTARQVLRAIGVPVDSLERAKGGHSINTHTFLCVSNGFHLFLKFVSSKRAVAAPLLGNLLRDQGIPGPAILKSGTLEEKDIGFILMESVLGTPYSNVDTKPIHLYQVGRLLRQIHSIKRPGFGQPILDASGQLFGIKPKWADRILEPSMFLSDILYLAELEILSQNEKKRTLELLQTLAETCQDSGSLLHGDLNLGNVLYQGDVISGVIDWANVQIGPAEYDVAMAINYRENATALVEGYGSDLNLKELADYQFLISINKAAWAHKCRPNRFPFYFSKLKAQPSLCH